MLFRQKKSGDRVYLQVVENRWVQGRSKQRVIATLGRLDRLQESGQADNSTPCCNRERDSPSR